MKNKTKKRIKGSITVLMVIIMLPMMTMSAIIVDSSRINMARSMVSSAGDLAMNSALANYDTILKDVYGLFAMSQAEDYSDEKLAEELKNYFAKTLTSYGVVNEKQSGQYVENLIGDFKQLLEGTGTGKFTNFLDMNVDAFEVKKVENSALSNPDILRTQIVEYMKYRAPVNFGLSFLDSLGAFKNVQKQTEVVQKQVKAQESSQDVASACKKAMGDIREYDKKIDSINSGADLVKNKEKSTDGLPVLLKEYPTQVGKYLKDWGTDTYTHINQINLIFNVNPASSANCYLKQMNIKNGQWFINSSGKSVNTDSNSGINISVNLPSSTAEAYNAFNTTRNELNNTGSTSYKTKNNYSNFIVPEEYVSADGSSFKDLSNAVSSFVNFEKFLIDKYDKVKYSDVKVTLEKLYTLGKQYDNYYQKIQAEINAAQARKTEAETKKANAQNAKTNAVTTINTKYTNINDANTNAKENINLDIFKNINKSENLTWYDYLNSMVSESLGSVSSASSYSYSRFKENSNDSDYKYLKTFKSLINLSSIQSIPGVRDISECAKDYLALKEKGDFSTYLTDNVLPTTLAMGSWFKDLLIYLYNNEQRVIAIKTAVGSAENADELIAQYQQEINAAQTEINNKTTQRNTATSNYNSCVSSYDSFVVRYQTDLRHYDIYQTAAHNEVNKKAGAISSQFTKILSNLQTIIKQLELIESDLTTVKKAIEDYNTNLNAWSSANNTYKNSASNDSFSKQNDADINASKTQYNLTSLKALQDYVTWMKEDYQKVFDYLNNASNYGYGGTHISKITNWEQARDAVKNHASVKDTVKPGFSLAKVTEIFPELYNKNANPPEISVGTPGEQQSQEKFLKDNVVNIQFLKYLNENYPESNSTSGSGSSSGGSTSENPEGDYNKVKGNMKEGTSFGDKEESGSGNSQNGNEGEAKGDKYGYTYKGKSVSKDNLPSEAAGETKVDNSTYKMEEDEDGKVNASDGLSEQTGVLGTLLNGIADVATGAIENTYILSYIFENFSYNTMIQDAVMKGEKVKDKNPGAGFAESIGILNDTSVLNKYKDKQVMLNGYYTKQAANNYFYGSEVEYILYGSTTAATNVTRAKASIYAIRFAFNCIYAFTDSTIRNTTRAAGLAVQAATMGFVPYMVVQIVLQLALAAAESAIDLQMMENGLKVAVVKTDKTWSLSFENAANAVAEVASAAATKAAEVAIDKVADGLQGLVDAGAGELEGAIDSVRSNVKDVAENKAKEILDAAMETVQSTIEEQLNEIMFTQHKTVAETKNLVNNSFDTIKTQMEQKINSQFGNDEIGKIVAPIAINKANSVLDKVKGELISELDKANNTNVGDIIAAKINDIKVTLSEEIKGSLESATKLASQGLTGIVESVQGQLDGYINEAKGNLTEKASEEIKEKVSGVTNDFFDKYIGDGSISNGVDVSGEALDSSVSSIIKFGYKDYLMLFTFIALATGGDSILKRTADVIQMNVQNAAGGVDFSFKHKKGADFLMKNACTYISADNVSVKLDMLFLNMDFFTNIIKDDDNTEVEGQLTPAATIKYKSLYGY